MCKRDGLDEASLGDAIQSRGFGLGTGDQDDGEVISTPGAVYRRYGRSMQAWRAQGWRKWRWSGKNLSINCCAFTVDILEE